MKSAILTIMVMLSFSCHAGPVEFKEIREAQGTATEIFDAARQWIAETYVSADSVIEHEDRVAGVIIGNGVSAVEWMWSKMMLRYKLRIDIKDQRVRLTLTSFTLPEAGNRAVEDANRSGIEPKAAQLAKDLADSLQQYVAKAKSSSDW